MPTPTKTFEKQYFPHDFNARGDENIIALMAEYGMAGYGIYWVLVEKLFEADGYLEANYKLLAFDLRVDVAMIKAVIEKSKLFKVKNGKFYSESVLRRLEIRRNKSAKASMSAKAKWEKEDHENNGFRQFWKAYPNQTGPDAALAAWLEKKPPLDKCLKSLSWQVNQEKWKEDNGRWIPKPETYIREGRWKDIPAGHEEATCPKCGNTGVLKKNHKGKVTCSKCGHEEIK